MQSRKDHVRGRLFRGIIATGILFLMLSCDRSTSTFTSPTDQKTVTNTALIAASESASSTPINEHPVLPEIYQSEYLHSLDIPRTYLPDMCRYLRNRWHPLNAQPGTVVMIIMIKDVFRGTVEEPDGINVVDLGNMMHQLHEQGFEAINTEKFLAFMERNVRIPPRSVLIIQDNSHPGENFDNYFREYWENWGWPVVNGWQSGPQVSESLWNDNIVLENQGWVDHQAQGILSDTVMTDDSSKVVITRELQGSIDAFAERFGKTPLAIVWPGGGFGQRPVRAARELDYQLGFTTNSRGPVMYNWVPLASEVDPERPTMIPEAGIGDPLMTLPRYWPYQLSEAIDQVRLMGNEAAAFARENQAAEWEYYNAVCVETHGPLPLP